MSASREKKQRRDAGVSNLSPRAQEEQKKAAQRKRNTIIYSVIGAVLAILVIALLIWNSHIIQRNQAVAWIDGEKVTAAQVLYYYNNNSIISNAQIYAQIGYAWYYDPYSSPKEQVIDEDTAAALGLDEDYVGKTFHDYFLDSALNALRQERVLLSAAKEAGYTLSDEGKENVESAMASLDTGRENMMSYGYNLSRTGYLQMQYGELMTERAYRKCLENNRLASEYYNTALETLANYSDEELLAFYDASQENKNTLDTVAFYTRFFDGSAPTAYDEDGNVVTATDELTAAAMLAAADEAYAALAEVEKNPRIVEDNEDYTYSCGNLYYTTSFYYDWVMDPDRQSGDATVFEQSNGYYLYVFGDRWLDEHEPVDVRHILISAMPEDDPDTEDVDESKNAPTDADFDAAYEKAQALLDQWLAGEATEESFAALVEDNSADGGSNTNGGLYESVAYGQMIPNFNNWIFDPARKSGDTGLVKNTLSDTQGWHIMYFVGGSGDEPVWKKSARELMWNEDLKNNVTIERTGRLDSLVD